MPRIIGVDNAVEWICAGADKKADAALKDGVVDAVVTPDELRDAALSMLKLCIAGKLDWKSRRAAKLSPLKLNKMELTMAFTSSMAVVGGTGRPQSTRRRCWPSRTCRKRLRSAATPRWKSRRSIRQGAPLRRRRTR